MIIRNKLRCLSIISASFFGLLPTTTPALNFDPISAHMGIDYHELGVRPRTEFKPTFPIIHEGSNIYAGFRSGDWRGCRWGGFNWGLDLGWENSEKATKIARLPANFQFFNMQSSAGDVTQVQTRFKGWHTDLMVYKNIVPAYFDLLFTAGVAIQRPHATIYYTPQATGVAEDYHVTGDSKLIGRFGFGAQWMFLKWLGVRGLVTWSNNRPFTYYGQQNTPAGIVSFEGRPYNPDMGFYLGLVARTSPISKF